MTASATHDARAAARHALPTAQHWQAAGLAPPVHLDDALVVMDKPAGLLSVPGRGPDKQDCLASRVQAVLPDALVVHRLDMATSGLIVLARGALAQRALSLAFARRDVFKRYEAVVHGLAEPPAQGWGTIDLPLVTDWPRRPRQKVCFEHGKPSLTRYRVLAVDPASGTSRVELEPLTGRSHQLRVHLTALGHPIVGDALYVVPSLAPSSAPRPAAPPARMCLHATRLGLPHPVQGQWLEWTCAASF